jgi:uncharacterized protein DUF4339
MANLEPDPTEASLEWLFREQGQVFGPLPEAQLVGLLLEGRIGGSTEVAPEGGAWRPLAQVPGFLVHLRKAEARARVEAEVTGVRKLARRRSALTGTAALAGVALLVLLAGTGAWWLAVKRPWEKRSALLESFGDGIAIGNVKVGVDVRASLGEEELALPGLDALASRPAGSRPGRARPLPAARPARPPASGEAQGSDLVLARYDVRRIQEVVGRRQGSLAPCLRDEARRSPEFAGEIPVEFAVGNDGRVAALWIDEPRFKSGELRDCLLRGLKEWEFDRFPGQRPVVSMAFRIGGR